MIFRIALAAIPLIAFSAANAESLSPNELVDKVGIEPKFDARVPLDLEFQNESGKSIALGDFFGEQPVILSLVYFQCPRLCGLTMDGLIRSLRSLDLDVGSDFQVVTVSFDPREGPQLAAAAKETAVDRYGRKGAASGWHFLTGREESSRALADAVGFRYAWDDRSNQYAHAAAIMVLTPEGRVSRYFYGVNFPAQDLRFGLIEASDHQIGTPADSVLMLCYQYDPATGTYGLAILSVLRVAGIFTLLAMAGGICWLIRRERRKSRTREKADCADTKRLECSEEDKHPN